MELAGHPSSLKARMSPAVSLIYRVQMVPRPTVIDADGLPPANFHVVEIVFPGDMMETTLGKVNTIVGPEIAKIIVSSLCPGCRE
jgi:hypothetical protein